jgi:predicted nucleic acid-binding protein
VTAVIAVDTSLAVPLLVRTHDDHGAAARWAARRNLCLSGHALVETYSVLTRLPGEARLRPTDAGTLMDARFDPPIVLSADVTRQVIAGLVDHAIAGAAVYDALVALAAVEHGLPLATRDQRARGTYEALGARVIVVA